MTGFIPCWILALIGCARPVEVELQYDRPAEHDLPRTVRVLDIGRFTGATAEDDRWAEHAREALVGKLSAEDVDHRRFKLATPQRDADAVVDSRVRVVTRRQRGTRERPAPGEPASVEYVRWRHEASVGFTIADARTSGTLATVTITRQAHGVAEQPPPPEPAIGGLIDECVEAFVARISPRRVSATEYIPPGESEPARRADVLAAAGDHEAALQEYLRAVEIKPADHNSMFAAGVMCESLGRLDQARRYYQRAAEIAPRKQYTRALERVRP